MRPPQVLVVDDDRDLARSLAGFVEMHGFEATVASNGQEAVEHHRKNQFHITFMDVSMPVMNGVDSFLAIRGLQPDARVALMTGFREPIVDVALEAGAVALLQKPFQLSELLALLGIELAA
jgi:two-component system, NtrC family, response regulator HydG